MFFSRVGCLKKIIIIAGPNGAGKTTFARDFLPSEAHTFRFINADLIAAGLAPFNPESAAFKAGRLMLLEIDECVAAGHDFAFETMFIHPNLLTGAIDESQGYTRVI